MVALIDDNEIERADLCGVSDRLVRRWSACKNELSLVEQRVARLFSPIPNGCDTARTNLLPECAFQLVNEVVSMCQDKRSINKIRGTKPTERLSNYNSFAKPGRQYYKSAPIRCHSVLYGTDG